MTASKFKTYSASVCLGIFLIFSVLPAALILIDVDNQIQVAFTITEEERKCPVDEKSILDMSLAFAASEFDDDQSQGARVELDDERWILKPVYYNVICPPPEIS